MRTAAAVVGLVFSTAALAQGSLKVMDSNGATIGPLLPMPVPESREGLDDAAVHGPGFPLLGVVVMRVADRVTRVGVTPSGFRSVETQFGQAGAVPRVYFTTSDCTGSAHMTPPPLPASQYWGYDVGIGPPGFTVYRARLGPPFKIVPHSYTTVPASVCRSWTDTKPRYVVRADALKNLADMFSPPFHIESGLDVVDLAAP